MTTERKGNAGASLFSLSRLIGAMTTAATKSNSGTRIAHNRPGAAGVIAANITATTQRKAISLRTENMVPTYCPMIHLEKNILDVMHAPSPPIPMVSPTHDANLLVAWQDYPPISRVATPFLRLAGARVEPRNHSKHDTPRGYGITPCATNFDLVHIADGAEIHVALPSSACPGEPMWAADGKRFAFVNIAVKSVELWIGDARTGEVHRIPEVCLRHPFHLVVEHGVEW